MAYNAFNRVVSTVAGGQARAAKYDAFGRRVERQISAEMTRVYFYDMGGRMLAEYDYIGSGAPPSRKYEYFAGQTLGGEGCPVLLNEHIDHRSLRYRDSSC